MIFKYKLFFSIPWIKRKVFKKYNNQRYSAKDNKTIIWTQYNSINYNKTRVPNTGIRTGKLTFLWLLDLSRVLNLEEFEPKHKHLWFHFILEKYNQSHS